MGLFFPAISGYIWRVLVGITGIFGFTFSVEIFNAVVWVAIIGVILLSSHQRPVNVKILPGILILLFVSLLSFAFTGTKYDYFSASTLFVMIFGTFTFFIQGAWIDIKRVSQQQLYYAAIFVLCVSIAYSVYSVNTKELNLEDNMDFAYKVLPSVLIIFSQLFTAKKKALAAVFSTVGGIFLLLQGTRGPILCLAIFICLMLYKKFGFGRAFFGIGAIVIAATLILSTPTVKMTLMGFAESIDGTGFSSRFVTMMVEGELSDANGRDAIKEILLEGIRENPFAVRGMFADRHATRGLVDNVYNIVYENGTYAHSLWLELVYDWGILIGGGLLALLSISIFRTVIRCRREDAFVVMVFVCTGFVHLFMSGSYLQSTELFFLIGLMVGYKFNEPEQSQEIAVQN